MACEVRFVPSQRKVTVPAGTSLIEAVRLARLPVASACGAERSCGRCGLLILEGADGLAPASPDEEELKRRNRIDPSLRLACWIDLDCDLVVGAPYW